MSVHNESQPGYVEPRDTDPLHQLLQDHISKCKQCSDAMEKGTPRGFGQTAKLCSKYFDIVRLWASGEYTREEDAKLRE